MSGLADPRKRTIHRYREWICPNCRYRNIVDVHVEGKEKSSWICHFCKARFQKDLHDPSIEKWDERKEDPEDPFHW